MHTRDPDARGRQSIGQRRPSGQAELTAERDARFVLEQDGLARERVAEIQRARILSAMVDVTRERGVANATVAQVVARAGVSRRTFYELFADRETCFLAAFDEGIAKASRYVLAGYDPKSEWAGRVRLMLTNLLTFLGDEPGLAWLLIVGSYGAGPIALEHRRRVLARIIDFVDEGRQAVDRGKQAGAGEGPPPFTAEGIVGGVISLIHTRMIDGDGALIELLNPLVSMTVLPYLGPAASRREMARIAPTTRNGARAAPGAEDDPLRTLDMRLTYRTVRVLLAIAAHTGASNRQVADSAGIRDQGQISKLLSRLQELGLIHNAGDSRVKGEPNSWALTAKGLDVQAAITPRATDP
jgi:AcrR family transcriptional regulator